MTALSLTPPTGSPALGPRGLGRRLAANSAANFVSQGLIVVIGLATTPYIINHLGATLYGVLVLLFAYIEAFALVDFGINVSLVKYLAELLPQRRTADINAYLGTALTLFIGGGVAISLCVVVFASELALYALSGEPELSPAVVFGFWVASGAFVVRFVGQAFAAVPIAAQRFDLASCVTVASETVRASGSVAALYSGYGLEGIIVVNLAVNVLAFAANVALTRHLIPEVSFRPRFSRPHCRAIVHFTKFLAIANISGRLVHSADKVILSHLLSVSAVAFYAIPYGLAQKLWLLVGSVTSVVLPTFSALTGRSASHQLVELYVRSSRFVAAVVAFPALALWLFRYQILEFWIGPEFAAHGALPLGLLSWGFLVNSLAHVPVVVSQAIARPQIAARFAAINASLNLVLLVVLAPRFGIAGAAAGFLAVQLIMTPWFVRTINRALGASGATIVSSSYLSPAAACAIAGLVCWLLRASAVSLISLAVVVGVGLATYAFAAFFLVLSAADRAACWSLLATATTPFVAPGMKRG